MINNVYNLREDDDSVTLTTYILDDVMEEKQKRPAVVIFPGGGYAFCSPREGEPYAIEFMQRGMHAFVATYSLNKPYPESLKDASRAVSFVRQHADEWNVDADNIYICGSSAGGHLAASLGVFWDKEEAISSDYPDNKPSGMILCYPVILSEKLTYKPSIDTLISGQEHLKEKMSIDKQVTEDTPKAFIWHTFADEAVPVENSLFLAQSLRDKNVPFELHIYPEGGHGAAIGKKEITGYELSHVQNWIEMAANWVWRNAGK